MPAGGRNLFINPVLSIDRHIPVLSLRTTGNPHLEMMEYIRFALALIFVLGLVAACSWLGKRIGLAPRTGAGGKNHRLSVIEVQAVDARRKLVLIRRDNVEHLILLNGERDLLIEGGISFTGEENADLTPPPDGLPKMSRILPFSGKFFRE